MNCIGLYSQDFNYKTKHFARKCLSAKKKRQEDTYKNSETESVQQYQIVIDVSKGGYALS